MTDQPVPAVSSFELLLQGKLKPDHETKEPLRSGSVCPQCGQGKLDYNGMLALECPECGFTSSEGAGCT